MSSVNALITQRTKKEQKSKKMKVLADQSVSGSLSSFTGIFGLGELSQNERTLLESILNEYATGKENLSSDLESLMAITSEVKAINNQAAMLHGERIKKAHSILVHYRDGAFTSWLLATYGNRQTPYNFLKYYEFYQAMPKHLHPKLELMPRQAIYTLASREGALERKKKIVETYQGETKSSLLALIREKFPLGDQDKRRQNFAEATLQGINRLCLLFRRSKAATLTKKQKEAIYELLQELKTLVEETKTR